MANDITGAKPTLNDDLASDSARVEAVLDMSVCDAAMSFFRDPEDPSDEAFTKVSGAGMALS